MYAVIDLPTEEKSQQIAARMTAYLTPPLVITFSGEIGAGKTTIIRAMLRALGITSAIKSPTFSLVESYNGAHIPVHHFDLYRIHDETELDYMGFRDYFTSDAVCCIEWPERAVRYLEHVDLAFSLKIKGAGREMTVQAFSSSGMAMLTCLAGE